MKTPQANAESFDPNIIIENFRNALSSQDNLALLRAFQELIAAIFSSNPNFVAFSNMIIDDSCEIPLNEIEHMEGSFDASHIKDVADAFKNKTRIDWGFGTGTAGERFTIDGSRRVIRYCASEMDYHIAAEKKCGNYLGQMKFNSNVIVLTHQARTLCAIFKISQTGEDATLNFVTEK